VEKIRYITELSYKSQAIS